MSQQPREARQPDRGAATGCSPVHARGALWLSIWASDEVLDVEYLGSVLRSPATVPARVTSVPSSSGTTFSL